MRVPPPDSGVFKNLDRKFKLAGKTSKANDMKKETIKALDQQLKTMANNYTDLEIELSKAKKTIKMLKRRLNIKEESRG